MTMTTIKVSRELRDRLKEQAELEHRTLGEQLEYFVERAERTQRFAQLREEMAKMTDEDWKSYREETQWWDRATGF